VNGLNGNEERENGNRTEPNTQRTGETLDTHVTGTGACRFLKTIIIFLCLHAISTITNHNGS